MNIPIVNGRILSPTRLQLDLSRHKLTGWQKIEQACADAWEIPVELLHQRTKLEQVVHPRMLAMRLLRNRHRWTVRRIADHFERDHAAVISGIRRINQLQEVDPRIREMVQAAERAL